jgi:hypothetical protein
LGKTSKKLDEKHQKLFEAPFLPSLPPPTALTHIKRCNTHEPQQPVRRARGGQISVCSVSSISSVKFIYREGKAQQWLLLVIAAVNGGCVTHAAAEANVAAAGS